MIITIDDRIVNFLDKVYKVYNYSYDYDSNECGLNEMRA